MVKKIVHTFVTPKQGYAWTLPPNLKKKKKKKNGSTYIVTNFSNLVQ